MGNIILQSVVPTFDFSFIVPTRNNHNELLRTMNALFKEAPLKSEIVLVDGNDDSIGEVKAFDFLGQRKDLVLNYVIDEKNGVFDAMNQGILNSHGKWIVIITAGDFLNNGAKQKLVEIKDSSKDAIVFAQNIVDQSDVLQYSFYPNGETMWPHQSIILKRKIYETIGLYPTEYKFVSDHYVVRRIKEIASVEYRTEILTTFCLGGISSGSSPEHALERYQLSLELGNGIIVSYIRAYLFPHIRYLMEKSRLTRPLASITRKLFFKYYKKA